MADYKACGACLDHDGGLAPVHLIDSISRQWPDKMEQSPGPGGCDRRTGGSDLGWVEARARAVGVGGMSAPVRVKGTPKV